MRLAGRSARADGIKASRQPPRIRRRDRPAVFIIGLVVSVAMLATALQGIPFRSISRGDGPPGPGFLVEALRRRPAPNLGHPARFGRVAVIGCLYVNINLFTLNAFYANRLVRCYLGASRPAQAPHEGAAELRPDQLPGPRPAAEPDDRVRPRPTTSRSRTWRRPHLGRRRPGRATTADPILDQHRDEPGLGSRSSPGKSGWPSRLCSAPSTGE